MNNLSLATRLQPRLMSLATAIVKECESKGHAVRLNVTTKDRFDIACVENGKPVQASDKVKEIMTAIVGSKQGWANLKGSVVTTAEEAKAEAPVKKDKSEGK